MIQLRLGYFKQGHEDMDPKMRVIDYIKETAQILNTSDGQLSAKQMCERFYLIHKCNIPQLKDYLVEKNVDFIY